MKGLKSRLSAVMAVLTLCSLLAAQPLRALALTEQANGIVLDTSEVLLEITEDDPNPTAYLYVQEPSDYFFMVWASSDPLVASVDGMGKVTGRAEGTAVITAYTERGDKASCTVTVQKGTVSRPALDASSMELTITSSALHPARQLHLTGSEGNFIYVRQWVSSDPAVATVSSSGNVTAQASGRATISALTTAGQVLRCQVTVRSEIGRVKLNKSAMLLQNLSSIQRLTASVADRAEPQTLTWTSSNPAVATVSSSGVVTAVGDGEAVITVTTAEGRSDVCYVAAGTAAWRYRSEEEFQQELTRTGQLPYDDGK